MITRGSNQELVLCYMYGMEDRSFLKPRLAMKTALHGPLTKSYQAK